MRPAPAPNAAEPAVLIWNQPTSRGVIIRNGTPEAAEFGRAWKARAQAENAQRMAAQARRDAIGSEADQVAALQVEIARHRALSAAKYGRVLIAKAEGRS